MSGDIAMGKGGQTLRAARAPLEVQDVSFPLLFRVPQTAAER